MLRGPSVRTKSFRKVQNSTRLPSALLREMEDLEGDDAVSDTAEASNGKLLGGQFVFTGLPKPCLHWSTKCGNDQRQTLLSFSSI